MYSSTFTSFRGAYSFSIFQGKQFLNWQLLRRRTLCRLSVDLGEIFMIMQMEEDCVGMKGRFNPKELPPTISSHLKGVKIICGGVDGNVLKVLKFLSKLNISKLASNTLTLSIFLLCGLTYG